MTTNLEALDEFIGSLKEAPDEDKKRGRDLNRGDVKTIITPRDTGRFSGLG